MAAIFAALQMKYPQLCSKTHAASARSTKSIGPVWADCVEKLVGFSLSKWVITLILLGRLYVDHDVSLWRAPTA